MDKTVTRETNFWELSEGVSRDESSNGSGRRHSSLASSSSSSGDRDVSPNSIASRSRRTRPSVSSASSQLATVLEQRERRAMSMNTEPKREKLPRPATDETVVSSKKVLQNFEKVASRNLEREVKRRETLQKYEARNDGQHKVYERLKKAADDHERRMQHPLWSVIGDDVHRKDMPSQTELELLARHHYPPRSDLRVHVCDFGEGRAEHIEIPLGEIEEFWQDKPNWVDVRWIHAPLGIGITHSSVEDIFLHDGSCGREFENGGSTGWPYLETEVLNLRSKKNFQEMRDVYILLQERKDLQAGLNASTWKNDKNSSLQSDVEWRIGHLGTNGDYWNLVASDMPWQLTERISMGFWGPMEGLKPIGRHIDKQALSSHPFFEESQLVRNPFRCFHRSDGKR